MRREYWLIMRTYIPNGRQVQVRNGPHMHMVPVHMQGAFAATPRLAAGGYITPVEFKAKKQALVNSL